MVVFLLSPILMALIDLTHCLHRAELARCHYVLVIYLVVNTCLALIRSCVLRAVGDDSESFCKVNGVAYCLGESFATFKAALIRIEAIAGGVSGDCFRVILLRKVTVHRRGWRH